MFRSSKAPTEAWGGRLLHTYQNFDRNVAQPIERSHAVRRTIGIWAIMLAALGGISADASQHAPKQLLAADVCAGTNNIYCYLERDHIDVPGVSTTAAPEVTQEPTTIPETTTEPPTTTLAPETTTTTTQPAPIAVVQAQPMAAITQLVQGPSAQEGVDISWPEANNRDTYPPEASFGILGINHGSNFTHNDQLAAEAAHFPSHMLYVNTDFPSPELAVQMFPAIGTQCGQDVNCIAESYGYQAGLYSFQYAKESGLYVPQWWFDVETDNDWWGVPKVGDPDPSGQEASWHSIHGEMLGITNAAAQAGLQAPQFGIYSTRYLYNRITGGRTFEVPSWVATGHGTAEQALAHCKGYGFTDGPTQMVQYVDDGLDLDRDLVCS